MLIVGAGLSGIGAACASHARQPDKTVAILEARDGIGGTWGVGGYIGSTWAFTPSGIGGSRGRAGGWRRFWPVGRPQLLSHRSAARLWVISSEALPHPTARDDREKVTDGCPGIALHRSRRIHVEDRAVREGIPVTSVARTPPQSRGGRVARSGTRPSDREQAEQHSLFDLTAVDRLIVRSRGRHGLRPLKAALRTTGPGLHPLRARAALSRPLRPGWPARPATNLFVAGQEVDMAWPGHG